MLKRTRLDSNIVMQTVETHKARLYSRADVQFVLVCGAAGCHRTKCQYNGHNIFIYYRKRESASYIVREVLSVRERERERERERYRQTERERDGSDVTIVTLKLAMNSHFPLPKIRTWRWAYTFPCQKFALLVSPFTLPVSPFTERLPLWRWKLQWVHTFHCQNFFALFVPHLSNGTSRATNDRKPKTIDQILPSPVLFFPSKKWIKLIPKTIGNRKRDCAWGGSGW